MIHIKKKHPKMDRYLISKQKWEIDYVVKKMHKEGHKAITEHEVELLISLHGNGRRKIYKKLRNIKLYVKNID